MNYPDSINNPDAFNKGLPANFDGVFNWEWTNGCFKKTKITPMDFDGVVERKKNYLVFETKDKGKDIPKGQEITLNNLRQNKSFTVLVVYGKIEPESGYAIYPNGIIKQLLDKKSLIEFVTNWYDWADKQI